MKSKLIFYLLFVVTIISNSSAQKILKVQGNKVVISTKNISVEEGDVLTINSDGFEAGKVKILKVGSKAAIGKITEGSALKGDSVSNGSSGGGSSSKSSSSSDDDYGGSKKRKKSKSGSGSFGGYLGLTYSMISNISSQQGDYVLDGHSGIMLKGEYIVNGNRSYFFGLQKTSGSATFTSKVAGLTITNIDVSTLNLFCRMNNFMSKSLYLSYGGQVSMVSVSDKMTLNGTGDHTLDLKGLGGLGGVGYNFFLGPVILQGEALAEFNYYFMNSSTVPSGNNDFDAGSFMTYGVQINFNVGYRF